MNCRDSSSETGWSHILIQKKFRNNADSWPSYPKLFVGSVSTRIIVLLLALTFEKYLIANYFKK